MIFFDRSPLRNGGGDLGDVAHLGGQVRHRVDVVGEILPGAGDALVPAAWPPSLPSVPTSRATRVTSDANDAELIDHRVDGLRGAQELAFERPAIDVQRHRLGEVALRDRAEARVISVVG